MRFDAVVFFQLNNQNIVNSIIILKHFVPFYSHFSHPILD